MGDADDMAALAAQLGPWLDEQAKPGWTPTLGPAPSGGVFSWYGAPPPGLDVEPEPDCGACGSAMDLILTLHLATMPAEFDHPLREGIVEVHYCFYGADGECDTETWEPYSLGHSVRLAPEPDWTRSVESRRRVITEWTNVVDRPDHGDLIELGARIRFDNDNFRFAVPDVGIDIEGIGYGQHLDAVIGTPTQGDKLGGWPNWVQNREYPSCRECGEEMAHLYQLDNGGPHGLMFGDAGCAYVSYCRTHPEVMTLLWQCH